MKPNEYKKLRGGLTAQPEVIAAMEKAYFQSLFGMLLSNAKQIRDDFNETISLKQFWFRYAPRQRGHMPRGTSLPWGEVGEKVLEAYLYQSVPTLFPDVRYVGLPYGHDVRFLTANAFVHIDIKSTGPTDNVDEVVSSPNQVSGDGLSCDDDGVQNSKVTVVGSSRSMEFQPELPPFYILDGKPFITLTFYLKCVYKVVEPGHQPLDYLELISVPNGLLLFDTLHYARTYTGLLTPGKDILASAHKRTRIKLKPLSEIDSWRCQKIIFHDDGHLETRYRREY